MVTLDHAPQIIVGGKVSGDPSEWEPSLRARQFPEAPKCLT